MFKSYSILLLSLVLTLSILTPALLSFTTADFAIVLTECNDDDSEEKDLETKDNEESEEENHARFFYTSLQVENSFKRNDIVNSIVFTYGISTPSLEIQLPPPEKLI